MASSSHRVRGTRKKARRRRMPRARRETKRGRERLGSEGGGGVVVESDIPDLAWGWE
jgi:hypothetical protein